ncbi:MAG: ABC transporter permease [Rhodothalassiaceae bacterium]
MTSTTAAAAARLGPLAAMLRAEIWTESLRSWRMPAFVVPTLMFPVGFYILFALVLAPGADAPAYLLATFGIFASLGPGLFSFGAGLATEREQGWLDLKRVAPVPASVIIAAKLGMCIAFTALVLALLYPLAGQLGGVALSPAEWALLTVVHLVAVVPVALLGLTLGLAMPSKAAVAVCNLVMLALAVMGGLWIPLSVFPDGFQAAAVVVPTWHLGQLALGAIGQASAWAPGLHVLAILIFSAAMAVLAARGWARMTA